MGHEQQHIPGDLCLRVPHPARQNHAFQLKRPCSLQAPRKAVVDGSGGRVTKPVPARRREKGLEGCGSRLGDSLSKGFSFLSLASQPRSKAYFIPVVSTLLNAQSLQP